MRGIRYLSMSKSMLSPELKKVIKEIKARKEYVTTGNKLLNQYIKEVEVLFKEEGLDDLCDVRVDEGEVLNFNGRRLNMVYAYRFRGSVEALVEADTKTKIAAIKKIPKMLKVENRWWAHRVKAIDSKFAKRITGR